MNHGDVVVFETPNMYRHTTAFFVIDRDTRSWIANPDDSHSGYLTIPKEVTKDMDDAMDDYRDILNTIDVTHVYIGESDIVLERHPIRLSSSMKWRYYDREVSKGREEVVERLLCRNYNSDGFDLHIETRKTYKYS